MRLMIYGQSLQNELTNVDNIAFPDQIFFVLFNTFCVLKMKVQQIAGILALQILDHPELLLQCPSENGNCLLGFKLGIILYLVWLCTRLFPRVCLFILTDQSPQG